MQYNTHDENNLKILCISQKTWRQLYQPVVKMTFGPRDITDKIADLVSLLDNTGQLQVTIYTDTIVTPMAEKNCKKIKYCKTRFFSRALYFANFASLASSRK